MNDRPPWEPAIREAHSRGLTTRQIAEELGYTPHTVRQYLYLLGLPSHRPDRRTDWRERLIEAHGRGLTTPQLVEELGWSIDMVRKRLSILKLPSNRAGPIGHRPKG